MKTEDAIRLATSAAALASIFGITPSAVSQWGEELPEARYWELRVKKPEWFNPDGSTRLEPGVLHSSANDAWDGVERRGVRKPS